MHPMHVLNVLSKEQEKEVVSDLLKFVHRVALDKNASPAEVAALPEIAKALFWLNPLND